MKKLLFVLLFSLKFAFAATISTLINSSSYTQILGPGGSGYLLSAYQPMQCSFATTIPAPTTIGHAIQQTQQTSIDSIGSGVYLWCKSNAAGLNYATTTSLADAATWGNGGTGGASGNVNINQVGGSTYSLGQHTMSASMPVVLPSNQSAIPVTESGAWNITNITGTVSLPSGAATNAGITGVSSKTLTDLNTTLGTPLQAGGNVVVTSAPTTAVTGTFWQTIQPISGTVTANIGTSGNLALDASVIGLQVSQASTTSGQKGALALGAVTTAAPTYTTAQSDALSLTTSGALRTDSSATTQPVSGTVTITPSGTQAVSGTVTANAGTNLNTSTLALETGGNLASVAANTTNLNNTIANAGSTPTKSLAVQGISGGVAMPVSGAVAATQSGTWTVQPGNTANTTPHLATVTPVVSPLSSSSPTETTTSAAYEASHIVKGNAGVLYALICYNSKSSAQFVLTFNSTTLPADTTVSVTAPMSCNASSNCTLDFGQFGKYYSTGIVWSNSSTSPAKTIGSSDMFCEPRYQ